MKHGLSWAVGSRGSPAVCSKHLAKGSDSSCTAAELWLFTRADLSALCFWRNTEHSRTKSHLVVVSRYVMWLGRRQGVKAGGELGVDYVLWFFPEFWTLLVCWERRHWF